MKKLILLAVSMCLTACSTPVVKSVATAKKPATRNIATDSNAKIDRCYQRVYDAGHLASHPRQLVKRVVVALYESTTDQYSNFVQVKFTTARPVVSADRRSRFSDFSMSGTCIMVNPPFQSPARLDCDLNEENVLVNAQGTISLYDKALDSRNRNVLEIGTPVRTGRLAPALTDEFMNSQKEEMVSILSLNADSENGVYSFVEYNKSDCDREMKLPLSE